MKACPVCESQNPDGAKNCETCGEALAIPQSAPAQSAPAAPAAVPPKAAAPVAAAAATTPAPSAPRAAPAAADAAGPRYCPIEGLEYTKGSAEHADGYCSCGAELVGDRALVRPDAKPLPAEERGLPAAALATSTAAAPSPSAPAVAPPPPPPPVPTGPVVPPPGTWCLVVFKNKQPAHYHAIVNDETLVGRYDPASGAYPELDLSPFDDESATSRKHVFVYRQESQFSLKPVTNAGTQLGKELVQMGERRALKDGDVLILGGKVALKLVLIQ
jgi:hypothetical protein